MPLARRLASRYHHGREPFEDLVQVAYVGLVRAVDRFDPGRGVLFSSFAVPTITGELRRHFRTTSWSLHVPRGVQEVAYDISRVGTSLTHDLGRAPTVSELAEATGYGEEAIAEAMAARAAQETTSLDCPLGGGRDGDADGTLADAIGREDDALDLAVHRVSVAPMLRTLPRRDREVLFMRFAEDMTQTEIAERVGCSQMQISRILRRSITALGQAGG